MKSALCVLLFFLLAALYFSKALGSGYFLSSRDLSTFFLPPRLFWVESARNFDFPLWNPYYSSGHPLFATLQPGVLYPFSLFYLFLPFFFVFNYTIIAHFALAGTFTYALLRAQNASRCAASISGLCFMLSGYLISVHGMLSTLLSVTWVPLFLLTYFAAFRKNNAVWSMAAGAVGTVMFLGGGVEVCYVIFLLAFVLSLFPGLIFEASVPLDPTPPRVGAETENPPTPPLSKEGEKEFAPLPKKGGLFPLWKRGTEGDLLSPLAKSPPSPLCQRGVREDSPYPDLKTRAVYFSVFVLTFLGLSAVQLLPFMELGSLSTRSAGLPYWEATTWSLRPADLLGFFILDLHGDWAEPSRYWKSQNWLTSVYLGSGPFLLSLFFFRQWDRRAKGFLLLILVSILLALGKYSPVYSFLYEYFPFFDKVRFPVKFLFLAFVLISLAAGHGFDRFREGLEADRQGTVRLAKRVFTFGFFCMVLFGFLYFFEAPAADFFRARGWDRPLYNDIHVNLYNARRLLCFTGLVALCLFLWANNGRSKFPRYAIVVLMVLDLYFAHSGFYSVERADKYLENGSNMNFVLSDKSMFRIFVPKKTLLVYPVIVIIGQGSLEIDKERIPPGLGLVRKMFVFSVGEVTAQSRFTKIVDLMSSAPLPVIVNLFSLANVKYLFLVLPVESPDFKLVHMNVPMTGDIDALIKGPTIKIYENLKVLPRAFLVDSCRVVRSDEDYKKILSSEAFRPRETVLLDEAPEGVACDGAPKPANDAGEFVRVVDYKNESIELSVKTNSKKFLFMSESYYPGWKAEVDGKEVKIHLADYAYRAILLEPGEHVVRFYYAPLSFSIGAVVSLLTVGICAFFLFKRRKPG